MAAFLSRQLAFEFELPPSFRIVPGLAQAVLDIVRSRFTSCPARFLFAGFGIDAIYGALTFSFINSMRKLLSSFVPVV